MISPEWLLSFYAINGFSRIRTYFFLPLPDLSSWPNLTAAVYRYRPQFTRSSEWDPWKAMRNRPGHPAFVLSVATNEIPQAPEDWLVPIQSHYVTEDLVDWRGSYDTGDDLPFQFAGSAESSHDLELGPYESDHFVFRGVLEGI